MFNLNDQRILLNSLIYCDVQAYSPHVLKKFEGKVSDSMTKTLPMYDKPLLSP